MLPQEIIRKKRDGQSLSPEEIQFYIDGVANGQVNESHIAAFSMAVFFNGMSIEETFHLTDRMVQSGDQLSWKDLDGPVVDKHSTGGVGDKVSLMLAPIVASCGMYNPMISGRGLGHTGGTLDKLESIPGYNTTPDNDLFRHVVKSVGCAIIGQTANLAPADKIIYGVRDVTATVESIPLITASILSKKLSAGLDGLVMDIKTGNGAFAAKLDFAQALARSIIDVANQFNMKTTALITDMNQPLGTTAGNMLEVVEVLDYLKGTNREPRLHKVVIELASEMIKVAGLTNSNEDATKQVLDVLSNGSAAETFEKMVHALGGPNNILEVAFPTAPFIRPVPSLQSGYVSHINTRDVGLAVVALGGGRKKANDTIDHQVGLTEIVGRGQSVEVGKPLALVHAKNEHDFNAVSDMIQKAYTVETTIEGSSEIIIEHLI